MTKHESNILGRSECAAEHNHPTQNGTVASVYTDDMNLH